MRVVAMVMFVAACSPNYAVPDGPRRIDAPPGSHDAPPDMGGPGDALLDAPPDSNVPPPPSGILPDPASAAVFMWPSLQEHFHDSGTPCTGQVTVAVGDRAVCFVGSDDDVHCAGAVYTHSWGPTFVPIGQTGVDQIVFSPTFNSATGNSMCIHKRAGTVWCMGDGNNLGQFGDGTTSPSATFVQFGTSTTLTRVGMDWNTRCVLDSVGNIDCAGYKVSSATPVRQPGTNHHSFWTAGDGSLVVDDPTVFRQSNGSPCEVEADGVHCLAPMAQALSGPGGQIVDATLNQPPGGLAMGDMPVCWLEASGSARCAVSGIMATVFTSAPPLVAIATSFYSDSRCGVGNDGSLWCIGTNSHGELGTGTTSPVTTETRVAPPGMVKVTCN